MTPAQLLTLASLAFGFGLGLVAQAAAKAERDRLELEQLERGVDRLAGGLASVSRNLQHWARGEVENEATGARLAASEAPPRPKPCGESGVAPSSS